MANVLRIFALLCGLAISAPAIASPAPHRIVSLTMCADQFLIALADHGQIAALSPFARDPSLSYYADKAKAYPVFRGSAEEVLSLRPDLVITFPYWRKDTLAFLRHHGVRVLEIADATSLTAIFANIRTLSRAIGHQERGEALIRTMQADLGRLARDRPGRGRVAGYYQRRGYLTGTGTLWDEIMTRSGLVNLAARLDRPSLSRLPVEAMIASQPDFLVMDTGARAVTDRGTEMIHHPALEKVIPRSRRLYLPEALTVCGGPFYPEAVATLNAQIRKADDRQPKARQ